MIARGPTPGKYTNAARRPRWEAAGKSGNMRTLHGVVAQLGERRVRNAKVGSSILLHSTKIL